ncbi:unnamed protein product [Calicophoron daubneyi]|uniref:Cytidine deaminase n=1 Tax=Calicophoron daubneyi TaxID=300641 RepID=A0AAV2T6U9_CALDB
MPEKSKNNLIDAAVKVRENAYCPFSQFHVGAAVLTDTGEIYGGCNVENQSFPCGWCAEVSAIAAAVSHGHRNFVGLAVSTNAKDFVAPCGRCRQAFAEFTQPEATVYLVNCDGHVKETTMRDILPLSFDLNECQRSKGK